MAGLGEKKILKSGLQMGILGDLEKSLKKNNENKSLISNEIFQVKWHEKKSNFFESRKIRYYMTKVKQSKVISQSDYVSLVFELKTAKCETIFSYETKWYLINLTID